MKWNEMSESELEYKPRQKLNLISMKGKTKKKSFKDASRNEYVFNAAEPCIRSQRYC